MRREIFLHFTFWFSFFVFVTIAKRYLNFSFSGAANFWPFWLGGIIGTLMPDIDHLLYVYLKPQELTSQRVSYLMDKREIKRVVTLLYQTRSERNDLIFHTAFFQLIFMVLTFWMLTSSGSYFGRGLVLAFSLHLLVDQIVDLTEMDNFSNWLKHSPWKINTNQAKFYWTGALLLVLAFGFLL